MGAVKKPPCNSPCIERTFLGLKVNEVKANLMFQWSFTGGYNTFVKENKTLPSQGACLALQYLIGHKAKHSSWRKKLFV